MSRILIISDLHEPYSHTDSFAFLEAIKKKYKPERVVCIGDELDYHALSFHDSDPDLPSASKELELGIYKIKMIEKLFPKSDNLNTSSPYSNLSGVFAKTGSLRQNHNLSGYILKKSGEILFFSIMVNHYADSKIEIQKGITQLLKKVKKKLVTK